MSALPIVRRPIFFYAHPTSYTVNSSQQKDITVDFGPMAVGQRRSIELDIANEAPLSAEIVLGHSGIFKNASDVSVCFFYFSELVI